MEKNSTIKIADAVSKYNENDIKKCCKVIEKWNEFAKEHKLSAVTVLTVSRFDNINNRLKEAFYDIDKILEAVTEQPFLLGENIAKWKITLDYLIREPKRKSTYLKILEGGFK